MARCGMLVPSCPGRAWTLRRCALLLVLVRAVVLVAQDGPPTQRAPFQLSASLHTGLIIPHSKELVDVSASRPRALEIDALWLLADERHTRASGLVSRRGLALHLFDFDAPDLLGRMVSVTPFVEPMILARHRLHGSVRLGVGLAYLTRPYDATENPDNLFYSSPVSFMAMVNAYVGYRLTPSWDVSAGYNYNHISNGGMKQPNKGINFPTWSLGALYSFKPMVIGRPVRDESWREEARNYRYVLLSAARRNAPAEDGSGALEPHFRVGGMGIWGRRLGKLTGVSLGTEWIYDGRARELMDRRGVDDSAWQGALMGGPELLSGRIRFALLFGAYVFAPSWNGDDIYQRYQLSYTFGRGLLVGTSLKAHRHVANVLDLRVGWVW
jgi:hypothetical protein